MDEKQVITEVVEGNQAGVGSHLAFKRDDIGAMEDSVDREVSVYALDAVQSIHDVHQSQFKSATGGQPHVETLRVMHCSQLTELRGLHLFPNLVELNASSNSVLTMSGLESLQRLTNLNLSCNKITQIFAMANVARTLKVLNLSHNRIVSLNPLGEFAEIAALEVLDLTDNYIGELANIRHLSKFAHLSQLSFQKAGDASKGSNPICDFVNYRDTVQMYLPRLAWLDGSSAQGDG